MREQRGERDESVAGRILLAIQGSEEAAGVAAKAAEATGFDLHVVHVKLLPLAPPYPEVLGWREDLEWAEREARGLLDEQVEEIEDAGGTVAEAHLREERPAEEIVALAEEIGADLIVVGSRGRGGIRRAFTGSVSDWVVRPYLAINSPADSRSSDGRKTSFAERSCCRLTSDHGPGRRTPC